MRDKQRVWGAAGGAFGFGGAAAILSACCVAPWAVTLLGAAGVVTLMRLSFLQPWLLAGAALMLVGLFWLAYRPLPVCDIGDCEAASRRGIRRIAWAAAAFVAIVALMVVVIRPA